MHYNYNYNYNRIITNDMYRICHSIRVNAKRMAKLENMNGRDRRNQAYKYVVAEAQKAKVRLTGDEMITVAVMLVGWGRREANHVVRKS